MKDSERGGETHGDGNASCPMSELKGGAFAGALKDIGRSGKEQWKSCAMFA